ncbi:MAG: hypothetical protein GC155_15750 [Alphaproteobacteria bacterium]|nr:hypothetical protein [Alphaproteobacteria bacterium]
MRMLRWEGMALATVCAACASKPPPRNLPYQRPLGAVAWSDMKGLTQDQIRARLGLKRTGDTFASRSVRLDVGKVVAEAPVADLARRPCGREPKGVMARTEFSRTVLMTFVNGRLTDVAPLRPDDRPIDDSEPLRATCVFEAAPEPETPPVKKSTTEKVIAAVKWGMMAPDRSEADQRAFEHWRVIGDLHLGATPPGGVDAWSAAHAESATPGRNDETVLRIRDGGEATLRSGLLVEIDPGDDASSCLLRSDLSLACDQKRFTTSGSAETGRQIASP